MDKYEYNLKLEEIDKLVGQGDYQEAAKLADTIDWRRVRNVRTLCLISEIYEASGRLEDSMTLLMRAYKKSPVGRTVLYRLIEVTTKLGRYDEAIEYYSEYVQIAPHDNNRYILKYQIYKGRGSQTEELIAILEEYLGQEYTERWAYELAVLYQQAGQMQKCLATCDDLVLWFHSGKYVTKALELKKRYTTLTPKQQQIYEESRQAEAEHPDEADEEELEETVIQNVESTDGEVLAESIIAQTEKEIAHQVTARKAELEKAESGQAEAPSSPEQEAEKAGPEALKTEELPEAENPEEKNPEELQAQLVRSMRKIISGVVKRTEDNEDDIPLSVEPKQDIAAKLEIPEQTEQVAGQLSIDDILLSMSDQGRRVADAVIEAAEREQPAEEQPAEKVPEAGPEEEPVIENITIGKTVTEAAADELTDQQREALQYTNHPEKLLRNKNALPTYAEAEEKQEADLGKTRKIINTKEELMEAAKQEILAEKTIRIPTEQISQKLEQDFAAEGIPSPEDQEMAGGYPADEGQSFAGSADEGEGFAGSADEDEGFAGPADEGEGFAGPADEGEGFAELANEDEGFDELTDEDDVLTIPSHLRGLFRGFTEVEGLESQIANAILQAESKGADRTSRSGNILIFGAHASGKTTLAMNIAKAIAQDKGSQTMKIARIYAADLNRKDIAATVAKIAGGTLIIEEAGDLEKATVEQLTTAMEFRTDGLLIILEDEQQYIHELLMNHPRFTMKFTAQVYIPVYTAEELAGFGQIYANAQDYVIGAEAYEVFLQRITAAQEAGAVSVSDVIEMVSKAINRSNKFFRKLSMGKKRYDENDYVILFPKDIAR